MSLGLAKVYLAKLQMRGAAMRGGRGYPAGAILGISTSICYNTNTKT